MIHSVRCGLIVLMLLSGGQNAALATETDDEVIKRVLDLFEDVGPNDPGCGLAISVQGRTLLSRGIGLSNVGFKTPIDSQTAFEIASGSKTFTSACIALLMDQGKLDPDDDVRKFVTELQLEQPVSIRNLLRCESGVWAQFHIMPLAGWGNVPIHATYSKDDFLTVLSGQKKLPFKPGTDFQYGSGDTFLLGIVVERITGETLASFARKNLFEPLGMTRTWFIEEPTAVVENRATGHWHNGASWASGEHIPTTGWNAWNTQAFLGGGGSLATCVDDMLRWGQVYEGDALPRGKYVDELVNQGTVLGNRFILDMDAYSKRVNDDPRNPPAGEYRGLKRIQVTGGYWGFNCCCSYFPDEDTTIVCLSNSDRVSAFGRARQVADILLAHKFATDVPKPLPDLPEVRSLPVEQLKRFVGTYRREGNDPIARVWLEGDDLRFATGFREDDEGIVLNAIADAGFSPSSGFHKTARFDFRIPDGKNKAAGFALRSRPGEVFLNDTFRRVDVVEWEAESLQQFAGTYLSDELGAVYRFRVREGRLQMRVGSRRWELMKPGEKDEFLPIVKDPHNMRFVRFTRDANGAVDGFSIGFWRIRGLRFDRLLR